MRYYIKSTSYKIVLHPENTWGSPCFPLKKTLGHISVFWSRTPHTEDKHLKTRASENTTWKAFELKLGGSRNRCKHHMISQRYRTCIVKGVLKITAVLKPFLWNHCRTRYGTSIVTRQKRRVCDSWNSNMIKHPTRYSTFLGPSQSAVCSCRISSLQKRRVHFVHFSVFV